jgi:hypothetical protein
MTAFEVRQVMQVEPSTIYYYEESSGTEKLGYYDDNAVSIGFSADGKVEHVELSRHEGIAATYEGTDVFATKAEDVISLVSRDAKLDENDRESGYSFVFQNCLWLFGEKLGQ